MADGLVLVNGLPGSGKSTLAHQLAAALPATVLSKDQTKETLAGAFPDLPARDLGGLAMDIVWALAAATPGLVIVESFWFRPRDHHFVVAALRRQGAIDVVEVWCDVSADLAQHRYSDRTRAPVYEDARRLIEDWPDWSARSGPLALGPVLRVDTSTTVTVATVAMHVRELMKGAR